MGTWISHLRIAENLLAEIPSLDAPAFTCGSLGPDSGIPNADWSQFDPPKEITHFLNENENEGRIRDLEFYRAYVAGLAAEADLPKYSFILGYFFHLLSDSLWWVMAAKECKQYYAGLFAERGADAWWELKKDWYDLDFKYIRDYPDSLFWRVLMPAPNPPNFLSFLSEHALHHQLDYIRQFYSGPHDRVLDRPYPYLNEATMARYVSDSSRIILEIHRALQATPDLEGRTSALSLLPQALNAYEPPLGDKTA